MKIRIAVAQSMDGHIACVGPHDFDAASYSDPMTAATCYLIEQGHPPVGHYWIEADLPGAPPIPVVDGTAEKIVSPPIPDF